MEAVARPGRAGGRWWLLATGAMVWFLVLLDDTAVTIAVAPIGRGLAVGATGMEWVVNAYTVTFAVCTLSAGALADRWGSRPVLLAGVGVFTAASVVAGLAGEGDTLIAAGRRAFAAGITAGLRLDATLAVAAMLIAVTFIRTPVPRRIGARDGGEHDIVGPPRQYADAPALVAVDPRHRTTK